MALLKMYIQRNVSTADITGTSKQCPLQRGVRYIKVFPKLACFTSKTFSRVFWYSVIESKVCQKVGVGRRKLKTYQRISCLYDNLEATGWRVFVMRERANQRSGQECCSWFVLILTVKEKWLSMYNRNLQDYIHISIPAPLPFGHLCNWKTCQPQR